jgi:hypothetical protein
LCLATGAGAAGTVWAAGVAGVGAGVATWDGGAAGSVSSGSRPSSRI